ncbi:MAG: extracellular solute-binding protein [Chloroflexi bacterium]|nr:extracellular solute-binding protein [Chloroflexota bacterium]
MRMRTLSVLLLVAPLATLGAACGPTPTPAPPTKPAPTPTPAPPTKPALESSLVVYTPSGPELTDPILKKWAEKYPNVKVDVVKAGTGDILARIRAEKDKPLGDVLFGGSTVLHEANADLFEAVALPDDAQFAVTDKNNKWHAYTTIPKPIAVNTKMLKPEQYPKTMKELSDPKWKAGKTALSNPRTSGTAYAIVTAMVTLYGWDYVTDFLKNAMVTKSSDEMFKAVRDGEVAVAFINEDLGVKWVAEGALIVLIYPTDGVATEVDVFALIKGAAHPNAAKAFLSFLQSKEISELTRDIVVRRSMRNGGRTCACLY